MGNKIDVLWLHSSQHGPIGIVKCYDDIEERWKYYIGIGQGYDEQTDVQYIINYGTKYYDLGMIRWFEEIEI